jgi:hypothetical protein
MLIAGGAVLALAAGCPTIETVPPTRHFIVENETDAEIVVTIQNVPDWPAGEQSLPVPASLAVSFDWEAPLGDCYGNDVIATASDGTEIARLEGPVCHRDKWIFREDGTNVLEEAPR